MQLLDSKTPLSKMGQCMKFGYARVSSNTQDHAAQVEALQAAGCERIFSEKASGKSTHGRPEFAKLMKALKHGDVVTVVKLDRLARSSRDLQFVQAEPEGVGSAGLLLLKAIGLTFARCHSSGEQQCEPEPRMRYDRHRISPRSTQRQVCGEPRLLRKRRVQVPSRNAQDRCVVVASLQQSVERSPGFASRSTLQEDPVKACGLQAT